MYNISWDILNLIHFGTVGESYGVGLVSKYKQNKISLSFGEYANKMKKIRRNQINRLMRCIMSKQLDIKQWFFQI